MSNAGPRLSISEFVRRRSKALQLLPALLFVTVFALVPVAFVIVWSFWQYDGGFVQVFTVEHYVAVYREHLDIIASTFRLSVTSIVINVVVAYPVAYFIYRFLDEEKQLGFLLLLLIPAIVARPIRIYLWSLFVTRNGPLNQLLFFMEPIGVFLYNDFAVYVGLLGDLLPIGITLIWISLRRIDEALLSASYDLGASPAQTFRRITLPMSAPGIAAASIIMAVLSIGAVTIPQMLGGPSVQSVGQVLLSLYEGFQFPLAGAISMSLLAIVGILLLVVQRLTDLTALFEEIEG